jgi:hypothetical protein
MTRKSTKKCDPLLMLHGRILYRDRHGDITDVTEDSVYALKKFAEDGELVIYILNQCRKRLDLLFMAAEHRSQVDASLVRLAVEDIKMDLRNGSELSGYIHLTQEMFEHSEALPPLPTPTTRTNGCSLSLIKPS